jgi:hypothetical protein
MLEEVDFVFVLAASMAGCCMSRLSLPVPPQYSGLHVRVKEVEMAVSTTVKMGVCVTVGAVMVTVLLATVVTTTAGVLIASSMVVTAGILRKLLQNGVAAASVKLASLTLVQVLTEDVVVDLAFFGAARTEEKSVERATMRVVIVDILSLNTVDEATERCWRWCG